MYVKGLNTFVVKSEAEIAAVLEASGCCGARGAHVVSLAGRAVGGRGLVVSIMALPLICC